MPSPIVFRKRDPMGKNRGPGWYYKRSVDGKLNFSKYSADRDAKYHARAKARGMKGEPVGKYYPHAGDHNVLHRTSRKVVPGTKKRVFGWL